MDLMIFDFDGTICDSFEAGMKTLNGLADQFGYRRIPQEEWPGLRNLTTQEVMSSAGVSLLKLPPVVKKARREIASQMDTMMPFSGIKEALLELKQMGFQLGILTSNSEENVTRFLKNHDLNLFEFIYSGSSIFGKSRMIRKLLQDRKASSDQAVYVGDETRDIQAAKASRVKIVSVTWGFNSRTLLSAQNPDYLIDHPSELVSIFAIE